MPSAAAMPLGMPSVADRTTTNAPLELGIAASVIMTSSRDNELAKVMGGEFHK